MTGTHPVLGLKPTPVDQTIKICNESTSTVFAMIESKDAIEAVDSIAAVDGVDVLLVGSSDLTIDLGVAGQFRGEVYRSAMEKVSQACRKHGKILAVAGVYDMPDVQDYLLNTLGARFMLVTQDATLIAGGSKAIQAIPEVKR
jgi:2-keto-3-deoxy-L-rhamnonate aldolase RhmA